MNAVREHRSSESHFPVILQQLEKALAQAQQHNHVSLANNLQNVKETYAAEYLKAKENGGTAWPEFEKFVTQFERSLTEANKKSESQQG